MHVHRPDGPARAWAGPDFDTRQHCDQWRPPLPEPCIVALHPVAAEGSRAVVRLDEREHRLRMLLDLVLPPIVSLAQHVEHVRQFQGVVLGLGAECRLLLEYRQVAVRGVFTRAEQYQIAESV